MTNHPDIEAIVRRVVAELLSHSKPDVPSVAADVVKGVAGNEVAGVDPRSIQLDDKLVTVASLPRDWRELREIRIQPRTVVTPSARDLIRAAGIQLRRAEKATSQSGGEGQGQPPLIVTGSGVWFPTLRRLLCPKQTRTIVDLPDDAASLREAAAGLRSGHRGAVVIAASPYSVCWQAGRDDRLRPAVAGDWKQYQEIIREVPLNVLILPNRHWQAPAAANVIRHFYRQLAA